jgi:hypothetical protein
MREFSFYSSFYDERVNVIAQKVKTDKHAEQYKIIQHDSEKGEEDYWTTPTTDGWGENPTNGEQVRWRAYLYYAPSVSDTFWVQFNSK